MLPTPAVPPPPSPRRALVVFLAAGLLVLSAIGGVLAVVQHRSAVSEAVRDARSLTVLQARDVVEPVLVDAALEPGPAHEELDDVIRERVLGERVVRVKIWDASGQIVYSDDEDLIGQRFDLAADELEAFEPGGVPVAEVSHLDEAENRDEREFGKLLQVYLGVHTAEGTPLLFETYAPYDTITESSRRLWFASLPVLVGGLALLWLAQAPLAWQLATRLRASHDEREQLLIASLAASDRERQRLAADLHDGVVQGLSGASYTMSAAAARAQQRGDDETGEMLHGLAVDLRRYVRELRSLIVTITPPGLRRQPLVGSLRDLVAPLQDRGVRALVEVPDDVDVEEPVLDLLLRTTQEAVRNILRHAGAREVRISLVTDESHVVLTVQDDGNGFAPAAGASRRDSMGLGLLAGLAAQDGGELTVRSAPERGTVLVLTMPRHVREPVPA